LALLDRVSVVPWYIYASQDGSRRLVSFSYSGQSLEFVDSQSGIVNVFIAAVVVIYLILAA
jgi:multidrug efflux pump subunit AcrB